MDTNKYYQVLRLLRQTRRTLRSTVRSSLLLLFISISLKFTTTYLKPDNKLKAYTYHEDESKHCKHAVSNNYIIFKSCRSPS